MVDMTLVVTKSEELNNDLAEVRKALKRLANVKCRLRKMPNLKTYHQDMTNILQEEQLLKNVRDYLSERKPTCIELTTDDIANLDYEETCRAIRAIQSKKYHERWSAECKKDENGCCIPGTSEEYVKACKIEAELLDHRNEIKPVDNGLMRKSDLQTLMDTLKVCSDLSSAQCINRVEAFMKGH